MKILAMFLFAAMAAAQTCPTESTGVIQKGAPCSLKPQPSYAVQFNPTATFTVSPNTLSATALTIGFPNGRVVARCRLKDGKPTRCHILKGYTFNDVMYAVMTALEAK